MAVGGQRLSFTVHNSELNTIIDGKISTGDTSDTRYVVKASKWRALSPTFLSTNSPFVNADNEIYTGPNNYLTTLVFRVWCGMRQKIGYTDETKQTVSKRTDWYYINNDEYYNIVQPFTNNSHNCIFANIPSGLFREGFEYNLGDLPTGSIPEGMTPDNFIGGYFDNGKRIMNWSVLDENLTYIANKCNVINCSTIFNYNVDNPTDIDDSYGNFPFKFTNYYGTNTIADNADTEEPPYVNSFSNILYTPVINQIAEVDRPTMVQSYRGLYQRIVLIGDNFVTSSEKYTPVIEFCPIVAKYDSSQIGGDTSGQQDNNTI